MVDLNNLQQNNMSKEDMLIKSFEFIKKLTDHLENESRTGRFNKSLIKVTKDYKIINWSDKNKETYDNGLSHPSVEFEEKERKEADRLLEEKIIKLNNKPYE
tara:strand:- start:571 stop:876 length:306 start_codon:yes stop_codon:yes gene_type:complete